MHVYAGVSKQGRTPLFVTAGSTDVRSKTKGVTKEVYQALLQDELIPACKQLMAKRRGNSARAKWVFQQDNARAHTSKLVKSWLATAASNGNFTLMQWPAKSPDLSWIENMWAYVAARLAARHDLTEDNYLAAIRQEWEAIPQQVHDNIINSIRGRLQECIDMGGGNTSY